MNYNRHFNNVQSWLESSSSHQFGNESMEIQSNASSNAPTASEEPAFPTHMFNDAEQEERMSNVWNSTGAILNDIQKCSDFSHGFVRLKKKHLAPKPVLKKDTEPIPKQHKERWNDFEYISNSIQEKKSPNQHLESVSVAKAKTALAWAAAKPVSSGKVVNRGRGSLLIKTPESLSNLMEQIGAPSYRNHSIEDFINNATGKFDDTDESDSESSCAEAVSMSLSSAKGKEKVENKSTVTAGVAVKPVFRGPYIPPHRRNLLPETDESTAESFSSSVSSVKQKSLQSQDVSDVTEEQFHLVKKGLKSSEVSSLLNLDAAEFVPTVRSDAMKKSSEEKLIPKEEPKKPFFSLLTKRTLPVGVMACRNPTVLKLVEKLSDCEVTPDSKTKSGGSSYGSGESVTFNQIAEDSVLDTQCISIPKTAEIIKSGSIASGVDKQKNKAESPKSKIPSVHSQSQINAKHLYSKLSELKRQRNETDEEEDNLNSPDSCINDFSETSSVALEWNEEDAGGYSSGFSDNMADNVFTVERVPAEELSLVSVPFDDDVSNDDFYNRRLPSYCLQNEFSSDRRSAPHRASSSRSEEAKPFTLNQEDFPRL